jgi:hypothetical protein
VAAQSVGGVPLASATIGADGRFTLTVTAGAVDLFLAKSFYTSPGLVHTGVGIGQTTNLAISMNEAASGRPSVALVAPADDVGCGATVALTATAGDPNGDALSGNLVRAGWNYFLVEGDQSKGLHNPSFVQAVLDATLRKDLSY